MAEIFVNMGELKVAAGDDVLITVGLGSCVGVALYDPENKVGGMAHIFLAASRDGKSTEQPGKFADTAIPALLEAVVRAGGRRSLLVAKIAGGANLFPKLSQASLNVGMQNVAAVKEHLAAHKLPLRGEDVGGSIGRKMILYVESGKVMVQSIGSEPREI
ncbi:MAG: chemotaxis protein CheD [Firmicutes bacterium]|nr:chemotaxis protein CheD [Bacillota bacterium]